MEQVAGLEEALQRQENVAVGDLGPSEAAAPPGSSSFLKDLSMKVLEALGVDELSRGGADAFRVQAAAPGRLVAQELRRRRFDVAQTSVRGQVVRLLLCAPTFAPSIVLGQGVRWPGANEACAAVLLLLIAKLAKQVCPARLCAGSME